jgi:predicted XRE-type DNA-binding protein
MTEEIYRSCGNVFADLGFSNADEMLVKAKLVKQINDLISDRQLTQSEIAEILEIELTKVADLIKGKLLSFTLETLLKFLNILGQDVEITVKKTTKDNNKGKVLVNLSN